MDIKDSLVDKAAQFAVESITIPLVTATSQTGVIFGAFKPGYKFRIMGLSLYNAALAGTCSMNLKVGPFGGSLRTAVSAQAFTNAVEVKGTLSGSLANLLGLATDVWQVDYTTNGSGALTNGYVIVSFRAWPMQRDLGQTTP